MAPTFRLKALRWGGRSADALCIRPPMAGCVCAVLLSVFCGLGADLRRLRCVGARRLLC